MGVIASQITGISIVCPTVCSDGDKKKHQSSASLAFVRGIYRCSHKGPVTRKRFPFADVSMCMVIPAIGILTFVIILPTYPGLFSNKD